MYLIPKKGENVMWTFNLFRKLFRKNRRGALSLEVLGVLAVMGMVIMFAASQSSETRRAAQAAAMAHQLNVLTKGAQHYLDSNAASLLQELDKSGVNYLLVSRSGVSANGKTNLKAPAGATDSGMYQGLSAYLPVTFNKTSGNSVYVTNFKQDVKMFVYKGRDGAIHAIFGTSGGLPATVKNYGQGDSDFSHYAGIARQVSAMTGFGVAVSRNVDNTGNVTPHIVGQKGAWRFDYNQADHGRIPSGSFENMQLARPLYAYSAAIKDDMLYRVAIDGHPELNAMGTDLGMNGFKIHDSGTIIISNRPNIAGTTETAAVSDAGNGLRIEPYLIKNTGTGREVKTGDEITKAADAICKHPDNKNAATGNSDGHIFTLGYTMDSTKEAQTQEDLSGIWMCIGNEARLISDSKNSSSIKSSRIMANSEIIDKPYCPKDSEPSIYIAESTFAERQNLPSAIIAYQAFATEVPNKNQWKINIRVKTTRHVKGTASSVSDDKWTIPDKNDKLNYVFVQTACERKEIKNSITH